MGNSLLEEDSLTCSWHPKVHGIMCGELKKIVDKIILVLPDLESAQPGFISGIQILCSLNLEIEKAKLLFQHCAESSKLYLAITGESIKGRCETLQILLCRNLVQIQNMVPILLASQISEILNDLKDVKFMLELSEEEAGKAILALLQQGTSRSNATEISEFEAFQTAALRLHIVSPKASLIEKRCLKKLLDRFHGSDQKKESIVLYLLHLLHKHGKFVKEQHSENTDDQCKGLPKAPNCSQSRCRYRTDNETMVTGPHIESCEEFLSHAQSTPLPPDSFRCPLSQEIMHDPVLVASGQTYERVSIQKWFDEGHDTCPKTGRKLPHLLVTPNHCMKELISSWCYKNGIALADQCIQLVQSTSSSCNTSYSASVSSLDNSLEMSNFLANNKRAQPTSLVDISSISIGSSCSSFCSGLSYNMCLTTLNYDSFKTLSLGSQSHGLLIKLSSPPLDAQHKAAEDVKLLLEKHPDVCNSMLHNGYLEALLSFLEHASALSDLKAQRTGAQVLWSFVKRSRNKVPFSSNGVCDILFLLLDSGILEVLSIMQILSDDVYCKSKLVASKLVHSVVKVLESQVGQCLESAIKILHNLSFLSEAQSHLIASRCVFKLTPFLNDSKLAGDSIMILHNLACTEVGRAEIAETFGCISAVVELLDDRSVEKQEHAVAVLLSLCSHNSDHCHLVLKEGIIPSLVNITVGGSQNGKDSALKLLQYLRDLRQSHSQEHLPPGMKIQCEVLVDQEPLAKEKKPVLKSNFFGRKIGKSSKPRSVAPV